MTVQIDTTADNVGVRFHNQTGTVPSAPTSGYSLVFTKADGLYYENSAGAVVGPFVTGSASGGGALVLLEQHTASNSASLNFTTAISSTYDEYLFELLQLIPASGSVGFYWRCSTSGTFDTSSKYINNNVTFNNNAQAIEGQLLNAPVGQFQLRTNGDVDNGANYGVCGTLRLFAPGGSIYKRFIGDASYETAGTTPLRIVVSGIYQNTVTVDGVQFLFSLGNISSGIIRCYGVAKT